MKKNLLNGTVAMMMAALAVGCEKSATDTSTETEDVSATTIETAVGGVDSALSDSEQLRAFARLEQPKKPNLWERYVLSTAYAADTCSVDRFSPAIGSADCSESADGKTVTATFSSCTVGRLQHGTLEGVVTLSFDEAETCGVWINERHPTSGTLTRTMPSLVLTKKNGATITTSSDEHENWNSEKISGGFKVTFGEDSKQLEILGAHRFRINPNGKPGFDHSLRTTAPIVVSGNKEEGTRLISSGTVQIDHNKDKFSVATSFENVQWDGSCCMPVSGKVTTVFTGSIERTEVADFDTGTCGTVKLTKADGTEETKEIESCE